MSDALNPNYKTRPPQKKARLAASEPDEEIAEASEVEEIIEAESDEDDLDADVTFVADVSNARECPTVEIKTFTLE